MKLKPLHRRAFLRSAGFTIALPFLEAMLPLRAFAQSSTVIPKRFATIYFPHGTTDNWNPIAQSSGYQLRYFQTALEAYKADISFLRMVDNNINTYHPGLVTGFLTAKTVPKSGAPFSAAKTMDQYIADATQSQTAIRDLIMSSAADSGGESGQSGVYGSNLSWISPTTPATRYISNVQIFKRLFPAGSTGSAPVPPTDVLLASRKSMLDFSKESLTRLNAQLGSKDQQTVDQFLTSLREVEKKISATVVQPPVMGSQCVVPSGIGETNDYSADLDIKIDLLALAFQCDVTRVSTLLLDPEPGVRNMGFLSGVVGQSHSISHWRDDASKYGPMHEKVNAFYISKLVRLLSKLKQMQDSSGTVLDNSIVLFGSSNKDSHNHIVQDLPLILAGRGGGALTPGGIKTYASGTSLASVHLSIMRAMGLNTSSFAGSSTVVKL